MKIIMGVSTTDLVVSRNATFKGPVLFSSTTAMTAIDATPIGATTPSTGAFTTLSATGAITSTLATGTAPLVVASTTNVANLNASSLNGATFAAPGAIGSGTPSTGAFTTVSATGAITSTLVTGTPPLVVASSTNIPNLNASSLNGATFAAPGAIGGGVASAGAFTTISATDVLTSTLATGTAPFVVASTTVVGNLNVSQLLGKTWAIPGTIGSTTPSTGAFTTVSATGAITSTLATGTAPLVVASTTNVANLNASLLNGVTFAAPGAIGGTTPAAAAFTTVSASGAITSTLATGTAPFTVASTTVVANLNASALGGATFAAPGAIGGTTPAAGAFTTLSATGVITSTLATGTAPFTVASTTNVANLNASSLSGATFAAPGAIGSGTASTGAFTTLSASGITSITNATANTASTDGALVVTGGVGIGGHISTAGKMGIAGSVNANALLRVGDNAVTLALLAGANQAGIQSNMKVSTAGVSSARGFQANMTTPGTTTAFSNLGHYYAGALTIGTGDTVGVMFGFGASITTNAAANIGFLFDTSPISSPLAGNWSFANNTTTPVLLGSTANVVIGQTTLATNATDGFLYIPTCAGTPTGTPTTYAGVKALVYDTTNNKLFTYNGAWKGSAAFT